jgi:microsomal dipeptidase-like Zn-dependent dipeptidase
VVQPSALAVLALALVVVAPSSAPAAKPTRYSLAGGCYALRSASSGQAVAGAERLRMQATTLGSYLLYRPDRTVLAADDDGSVAPAETASPAADWRVAKAGRRAFTLSPASDPGLVLAVGQDGSLTVAAPAAAGPGARLSFKKARGCAVYPEAELDAKGRPSRGKTPYGAVGGLLEGHMHWMTYEYLGGDFHCGRPWHPYGIPYALPDCSEIEGPQGTAAPVQNFLNFGQPAAAHDTTGWPKLTEWGAHNLTYEGTYWRWIQRAWKGGLRLMVMSVNENRVLCELQQRRRNSCDEMETVRKGLDDIRELQRYVDAQAGGPGKGFFKIVTNPYQARRVINKGKMAVVLEIEVSELFGCRGWETSTCDTAQVDRGLDEFYRRGVRSSLLLNKFDNPLTGVRFDSGEIGVLINAGNRNSSGSFWSAKTCTGKYHDNEIETFEPQSSSFLDSVLATMGVTSGTIPAYPPAPHCNTRGLTDLGRHLERRMIKKHMIINPDHMSQLAVDDTLTLAEAHRYSGVISPHGWMDPGNWPRIWKLGGLAFPDSDTSSGYLKAYRKYRPKRTPYLLGWGYGADLGGLAAQPDAPQSEPKGSIKYPFKSYDGKVTFQRQRTGDRVFDYTKEGVAHYGLYADWFEDLRRHGGKRLSRDMWNGAEAYLEMWERAKGIRTPGCRPIHGAITAQGLGRLRLGSRWKTLLRRAGQPQQRTRAWSWCVRGGRNGRAADVAELSPNGRVELVASTARGRSAGRIPVGASAQRLAGAAHPAAGGVFVRRAGRTTYVYTVRRGRVRAVGVATPALARHPAHLREAMRRVRMARATQARPRFKPNPTAGSARLTGTTLAGSSDPRLNRALVMLCSLNR